VAEPAGDVHDPEPVAAALMIIEDIAPLALRALEAGDPHLDHRR
jgi:hypothetical protein